MFDLSEVLYAMGYVHGITARLDHASDNTESNAKSN